MQAASVKISSKKVTLIKGQSKTLKVNGTKSKVKWTSNKSKVAYVNKKGKVTARSKGNAVITAKVNGKKYTSNVTVELPSLNLKSSTLNIGASCNLKLNGTKQKVTWNSSKPTVANVTSKGKVTAKKSGSTTITAKVAGKKYYCKITVKTKAPSIVKVSSVQLSQSTLLLKEGDTTKLNAIVYPQNANNAFDYTRNSNVYFILESSLGGFTQSGIQDLANAGLSLSFTSWDYLLRSQVGLSMMDIGFLSYQ